MPGLPKAEHITSANGSDVRRLTIEHNNAVSDLAAIAFAGSLDTVWAWQTPNGNSLQALGRGSTDTQVGSGAFKFAVNGIPEAKAAVAAGTAVTAQTVPADTWAAYVFDIAAGGAITMSPAAANATTGYATEALAIAAVPARVTAKARMGYVTVKTAAGLAWIGATDGLAGGSSGNVASQTNYYPFDGIMAPTGVATNCGNSNGQWNGTRNGVVIPCVLSKGSTDTRVATTAFTFNAFGVTNIAKAAVAAGTAFGSLGTISADKWGAIVFQIDAAGVITYLSAPGNYSGDYGTEAAAISAVSLMAPTANKCVFGYVTIKTKAATAFIVGTDAVATGASGNPASVTNYYPVTGVALPTSGVGAVGMTASQIASRNGVALVAAQY